MFCFKLEIVFLVTLLFPKLVDIIELWLSILVKLQGSGIQNLILPLASSMTLTF